MVSAKLSLRELEPRDVPAVFAEVGFGTLTVFGDGANDEIVIARDEIGVISVNGEVPLFGGIPGGFPTVFNTFEITVFGAGGNDIIRLDETNGPLPSAVLFGGSGDDMLFGGSSDDTLYGQSGNDTVAGGGGDDSAFLGSGDDVFAWAAGDGSDAVEGQTGTDELRVTGSDEHDVFTVAAAGPRLAVGGVADVAGFERVALTPLAGGDRVEVGDLSGTGVTDVRVTIGQDGDGDAVRVIGTDGIDVIDAGTGFGEEVIFYKALTVRVGFGDGPLDRIEFDGRGGDDQLSARLMFAGRFQVLFDGGAGRDTIRGTPNSDIIFGGNGDDFVTAGFGDDVVFGGDGDDTLNGNSGDDVLDGGDGRDFLNGGPGDDVLLNGETLID